MDIVEARKALKEGLDVRRSSWPVNRLLRLAGGHLVHVEVDVFGLRTEVKELSERVPVLLSWSELDADDWEVMSSPKSEPTSICEHAVWETVRPYFGERPDELRGLEVRKVPRGMSMRLQQLELPCCTCGRPVKVFRRRQGADWSDLYYSPACPSAQSPGCSRGMECRDEVDRIRFHLLGTPRTRAQLGLFPK